eukprot:6474487-Amphidinium_carterae.1
MLENASRSTWRSSWTRAASRAVRVQSVLLKDPPLIELLGSVFYKDAERTLLCPGGTLDWSRHGLSSKVISGRADGHCSALCATTWTGSGHLESPPQPYQGESHELDPAGAPTPPYESCSDTGVTAKGWKILRNS